MEKFALEFHDWHRLDSDGDADVVAVFRFSMRPAFELEQGLKPASSSTFWTEVTLARDLATRGKWADMTRGDKVKAMYLLATGSITESGRKLREVHLFWKPGSKLGDGPPDGLSGVEFPPREPIFFEADVEDSAAAARAARKAAGLEK